MTLLMTVVTPTTIYQSSDYRLTIAEAGRIRIASDQSTKVVTIHNEGWHGFVSYTGIGRDRNSDTSDILIDWLKHRSTDAPSVLAEQICKRGSIWLRKFSRDHPLHTFLLVATGSKATTVFMISNFEDLHGRLDRTPSPALFISSRKYGRDLGIVVCGQESALTKPAIVQIKRMFWSAGDDPARMRERLARINAFAAASKIAKGTISPNCSVFSIRRDGTGRYDFNGALELKSLMSGTPIPDLRKLLKNIGYGDAKLIAAVSASSGPKLPYAPCKPIAVWPEGSEHYQILEVQDPRFSSLRAMAVNDTGVVAGDGVSTIAAGNTRPWRASTDRIMEAPDIVAHATAIDAIGAVALKTTMSDKSVHAAIWDTNSITDLGVYLGKSSGATAAAQGLIAGWVCIDPINQGQRNFRPAAWTDGKMFIQQQLPCDWGQAVAATECGKVLVLGYYGKSPAGFLWEPKIGKLAILGTKIGIYPVSLSRNGTVLGFAREAGESVAYKIESGSDWEPVGCAPGLYPTAINDVGDIVGSATGDGFDRPWLRYATGEVIWLPYFRGHWCRPNALNNHGTIVGNAASDHGSHALLWIPSGKR